MPKISIILPCYNVEQFVGKSIQSVLNQTWTDFELLVVIDGSPDNSKAIASSFRDSRISVYEKENGGLSDARNYGIDRATGDFIYFMDSDDWIEPTLLEDNVKIMEEEALDLVVFGYYQDNENKVGKIESSIKFVPKVHAYHKNDPHLDIDPNHLGILGYAWNKLYRKSFLDEHKFRFPKGISLVEDILFNAALFSHCDHIRFNRKAYYHYINREEETIMKTFHENSFELNKMKITVLKEWFEEWEVQNQDKLLAQALIRGIRYCIHNMFAYKNQLSFGEKHQFIASMYSDSMTRKYIDGYSPNSSQSVVYKQLIKHRLSLITSLISKIIK